MLRVSLGEEQVIAIEHFGSTAVPALEAVAISRLPANLPRGGSALRRIETRVGGSLFHGPRGLYAGQNRLYSPGDAEGDPAMREQSRWTIRDRPACSTDTIHANRRKEGFPCQQFCMSCRFRVLPFRPTRSSFAERKENRPYAVKVVPNDSSAPIRHEFVRGLT